MHLSEKRKRRDIEGNELSRITNLLFKLGKRSGFKKHREAEEEINGVNERNKTKARQWGKERLIFRQKGGGRMKKRSKMLNP